MTKARSPFASLLKLFLTRKTKTPPQPKTVLESIAFDRGYFVLPDAMGELPPMPTTVLDRRYLFEIFQKLKALIEPNYLTQFQAQIGEAAIAVLLTSNLSEAGRLSQDNEIEAYREFLTAQSIAPETILVIKPHPRDDLEKILKLQARLSDRFQQVIILSEPELFFLPFEAFFLSAFLTSDLTLKAPVRLFALSSACLSFKLLFGVPSEIGFGDQITRARFEPAQIEPRLIHDRQLRAALEKLSVHSIV